MVEIQLNNLLLDMGTGAFLGFVIGYIAKLVLKILLVIGAIYAASLFYLQQRGIITIHPSNVNNIAPINLQIGGILNSLVGILPFGGSFLAGFYLAFKKA